jgi:hypothetical protein
MIIDLTHDEVAEAIAKRFDPSVSHETHTIELRVMDYQEHYESAGTYKIWWDRKD